MDILYALLVNAIYYLEYSMKKSFPEIDEELATCPVCGHALKKYYNCDHISEIEMEIRRGIFTQEDFKIFRKQNTALVEPLLSKKSKSSIDLAFAFLHFKRQRQYIADAENKYNLLYSRFDAVASLSECISSNVKDNPESLTKHLQSLFNLESDIYSVGKRLVDLYLQQREFDCCVRRRNGLLEMDIRNQSTDTQSQYDNALVELNSIQSAGAEKVHVARPEEPSKPSAPILEKPGLFNKKKVLAHNDELTAAYEKACQQYEKAMAAHKLKLDECAAKEAQLVKEAEARYAQSLAAAEVEVEKAKARMEQSTADIDAQIEAACALPSPETVAKQMLDDEIAQAEKLLKELIECRNKLYACDVVFIKYRNMVALATFCEYLMAGRCTTLEGPDGAYNIFEAECRANQIIGQLTKIVDSLEQIKESQYLIYSQLQRINTSLTTMNATMQSMSESLQSIQADTHNMSGYMEKVAQNSDVIAHNSAVSAYYSKMNAELTNSLGYLVALH